LPGGYPRLTGGVPGFEADNELIPAEGLAWIALSDSFSFSTSRISRVVLKASSPNVTETPAAKASEDLAVTQRFRMALSSLIHGKIDRTQYTDSVNAALTPTLLTKTAAQLNVFGLVVKVAFVSSSKNGPGTIYSYTVTFANGQTSTGQFVLDASGKIAGIGSR